MGIVLTADVVAVLGFQPGGDAGTQGLLSIQAVMRFIVKDDLVLLC